MRFIPFIIVGATLTLFNVYVNAKPMKTTSLEHVARDMCGHIPESVCPSLCGLGVPYNCMSKYVEMAFIY